MRNVLKNKLLALVVILMIILSLTACYKAPKNDIAVYKTSAGEKYHTENCRYVRNKEIEIKLSKAIHKGLQPCKVCQPPTQKDLDELNK